MKKSIFVLFTFILLLFTSCEEDGGYVSMSAMESAVWIEINEFRTDNGKAAATANYDTMVEQAKLYSSQMAAGNEEVGTTGLVPYWDVIHERWGGYNDVAIVSKVIKGEADISVEDMIDPIKADQDYAAMLLSDVSIGGVGISNDEEGNAYMTILMMLVPDNSE